MEKNPAANKKAVTKKTLMALGITSGVVAAIAIGFFVVNSVTDAKRHATVEADLILYEQGAKSISGGDYQLTSREFRDSSEALDAFASAFEEKNENKLVSYSAGSSYAVGKVDPWGENYYITAKRENDGETSAYSFYVVSGGANKTFDTATMVADEDDIIRQVLRGAKSVPLGNAELGPSVIEGTDNDFGIGEIIDNKPPVSSEKIEEEKQDVLPARVTMTFNNQGGDGSGNEIRIKNGRDMKAYSVDVPTRENYVFTGYYTEGNGNGTQLFDANGIGLGTAAFKEDITVFADWIGEKGTVLLDNDGGTSTASSISVRFGETFPQVAVPRKSGYTFAGYYSAVGGGGIQYYDGAGRGLMICENCEGLTLYAFWSANSFNVEHYVMGTDGEYPATPTETSVKPNPYNMSFNVSTLVNEQYIIDNGIVLDSVTADGSPVTQLSIKENGTVVRIYYRRCEYNVGLDAEAGVSEAIGNGRFYYGEKVSVEAGTENGFEFSHWKDTDTGEIYSKDRKLVFEMPARHVNLEAYAEARVFSVTLDPGEGYCRPGSVDVTYGEPYYDLLPTPRRDGYSFAGWSTTKEGSSVIGETTKYTTIGNSTLYAVWEEGSSTITLDQAGGQGGTRSVKGTLNQNLPAITIPKRTFYTFLGYFEKPDGMGMQYYNAEGTPLEVCNFTRNTTLFAHWETQKIRITYLDKNGAALSGVFENQSPEWFTVEEKVTLPVVSRLNYKFKGWFLDPRCTGTPVTELSIDSVLPGNMEVTVYADWEQDTTEITLSYVDYGVSSITVPVKTGTTGLIVRPALLPRVEGKTLLGFFTLPGGKGICAVDASGELLIPVFTEKITYYAFMADDTTEDSESVGQE